jgi:hypothetical protein
MCAQKTRQARLALEPRAGLRRHLGPLIWRDSESADDSSVVHRHCLDAEQAQYSKNRD